MYGGDYMPKFHNEENLKALLAAHNVPLNDSVKRGDFYREYFDWDVICKQYRQGFSIRELCCKYNLSYDTMRENLKRNNVKFKDFSVKGDSAYRIKKRMFFPKPNMRGSYILGWLYSDGCIQHNFIDITLQLRDTNHLIYLASLFTNKPVIVNDKAATLRVYGVDFVSELASTYNLLKNKSNKDYRIPLNLFDFKTLPYMLLGLLEGDGSINKKSLGCHILVTQNTWNDLKYFLPVNNPLIRVLNKYGLIEVTFSGENYFNFLGYVYANTKNVKPLKRKYSLFLNQLQRSINGRTSPYKKLAVKTRDSLNLHT